MTTASRDDLEEIAEGKASARDKAEAGVASMQEAHRLLRGKFGSKVRTTQRRTKPKRKVKRRKH